jgi:hypothetical protein
MCEGWESNFFVAAVVGGCCKHDDVLGKGVLDCLVDDGDSLVETEGHGDNIYTPVFGCIFDCLLQISVVLKASMQS